MAALVPPLVSVLAPEVSSARAFVSAAAGAAFVASGAPGFSLAGGFACNGYDLHSPGHYSLAACFTAEAVLTFMFLVIIMGATDRRAPQGFAPIAIGLGLTLIHLVGIPVTNLSVNPARSTATALFEGGWALSQLWLFWLAPILGGVLGGLAYHLLSGQEVESPTSPLEKLTQQSEANAARAERNAP